MSSINFSSFILASSLANEGTELVVEGNGVIQEQETQEASKRQNTWKIFQRVICQEFENARIQDICRRYTIDFTRMENSAVPLLPVYVEKFAVGFANLHIVDLEEALFKEFPTWPQVINDCTPEQLRELKKHAYHHKYIGPLKNPRELTGGPARLSDYFRIDPFREDQKRLNLYEGIEKINHHSVALEQNHPFLQRLVMAIAHHDMRPGDIVEAPGRDEQKDFYQVYQNIAEGGLFAVALIPVSRHSGLRPLLVFRPTMTSLNAYNSVHTWLNNCEQENGSQGYRAAKPQLDKLVKDPKFRDFHVTAYSLGGAHAGYFFRDNWRQIQEIVFFNSVSNSDKSVAEDTAAAINALTLQEKGPSIFIYRNMTSENGKEGDWATFLGEKHVGWGIKHSKTLVKVREILIPLPTPVDMGSWMAVHRVRYLDTDDSTQFRVKVIPRNEVDKCLDNKMRGQEIYHYEEMRQKIGVNALYYIISIIYEILQVAFRIFGIELFRSSIQELSEPKEEESLV